MNSEEHRLTASTEKQLKRRPEGRGYLKSEVDDLIDGCTALYGSIYIHHVKPNCNLKENDVRCVGS